MIQTSKQRRPRVNVHVRWMIGRDLDEVLRIERLSFEDAWTEDELRRNIRKQNCIAWVAEYGDRVVGFVVYQLHKHHLNVLDLAIHPDWRRRGVGSQLVDKAVSLLSEDRRTKAIVHVSEVNVPAQIFLRQNLFMWVKTDRSKADDGRDAYRFEYAV